MFIFQSTQLFRHCASYIRCIKRQVSVLYEICWNRYAYRTYRTLSQTSTCLVRRLEREREYISGSTAVRIIELKPPSVCCCTRQTRNSEQLFVHLSTFLPVFRQNQAYPQQTWSVWSQRLEGISSRMNEWQLHIILVCLYAIKLARQRRALCCGVCETDRGGQE